MIKIKTFFSILLVIMFFLSSVTANVFTESNKKLETKNASNANWTVLYYLCGDSNMDVYIEPILNNLSKMSSNENINILILKDNIGYGNSRLYYLNENGELNNFNNLYGWPDEVDMNDPNTFELFCKQMMTAYPANHYAFITFASAGFGWQRYSIHDYDSDRYISIPDFANSLKNIIEYVNHKIDVFFVSCAGNAIEIAYEFAPYIDYIVGTQTCFSHDTVVSRFFEATYDLYNNTDLTPEEFAKKAPLRFKPESFNYYESYYGELPLLNKILNRLPFKGLHTITFHPSSAVVNLSHVNNLTIALNDLSSYLILNIQDEQIIRGIKNSRNNVRETAKCHPKFWILYPIYFRYGFEITGYNGNVDLYHLIMLLKQNIQDNHFQILCNNVFEGFNKTIPVIKKVENDTSYGLNIYFAKQKILYNKYVLAGKVPVPYEELKFSKDTNWDEFLKTYLKISS